MKDIDFVDFLVAFIGIGIGVLIWAMAIAFILATFGIIK
jgi:hypothetical protein